ncbi:Hsp70 family protein [Burkholderia thailandensis]|uniref:Hsp70 family protein n=1 Tax=Burkholderia thailandensis TaxID=57975 RepID=A0AAW9CR70_BURTH|nr:Hsp70 family protein [Burkholderia thailandensis]AHI66445.1 hsp70 family protein [Burkholderia thailandensis H0587]AIP65028.1 molecular chaperone DnaK [Burkholderia thailandensis]AOI54723.1 molecular chaperone DnaK [Burkholderia thailandensis]AOJ53845.1 molecular chaperone DnaK [Burkholderia thailandensis]AVR28016.1 molecular chaperone DnaK [Burkholderia thailandensis]
MKRFIVGIDLGTSNTVVAYVEAGGDAIRVFDVDQLVAPGEVGARPLLPSARYHPAPGEFAPGELQLPWRDAEAGDAADAGDAPPAVIGTLARTLGAQVPGRLVTSAKSWLSHASVDRLAPILPWGAADAGGKVSPVAASASYLAHVRAAWNRRFPDAPLEQQDVVLTVPASFDDGARSLTLEAARLAKLPALRLLEEPQAAFYDWLFHHRDSLREELARTRLVLVCDVGGGTTDLTLIKVHAEDGEPQLTRIGVGDHLMLGGDNMDLALARVAEARLAQDGGARLSAASLSQLVERCRAAKERLLDANPPDSVGVTLLGAGARLVGGARKTELGRAEVEQIVVDGFFPAGGPDDLPRRSRAALVEFGLPYAADAAVTRHVAAFLHRLAAQSRDALGAAGASDRALPVPDTLLLNGGVFRSRALAERVAGVLGDWRGQPLHVLRNDHPDVAVARGAVAYGLARAGRAPRIGGGSPRSYFLVVDDGAHASRGVCVLPRGTAEGHDVRLDDRVFALRLGHPVRFHLASTVADHAWRAGELADLGAGGFVRLPPVATVVRRQDAGGASERLVKLTTSLTEVGTLDMRCIATDDSSQRWQLEFQLRREPAGGGDAADASRHPSLDEAIELIDRSFGARLANVDPKEVRRLRGQLEQLLGARDAWDIALLRELFGALWARAGRRRRSADHERVWLNLAGYCVRPGFGHPLDDWRVAQLWTLFDDGIQYVNDAQVWSEWWTLWRRAAGGLDDDAQREALDAMAWLQEAARAKRPKLPFDAAKIGDMDIVRLSASLERVPVERKIALGEDLLARLRRPAENHQCWWAIGRIGARRPLYGSAHGVVPPDVAGRWLDAILAVDWKKVEPAAFAAAQIARMTGDRSSDVAADVRERVVRRLAAMNASDAWVRMVSEVVALDSADTGRAFGESLPAGLKLVAD